MFANPLKSLKPLEKTIFWGVLLAKLFASPFWGSRFTNDLFIPFIDYFVSSHFSNPWQHFVNTIPDAFPYSGVMLFVLSIPRVLFAPLISTTGTATPLHLLALKLPLLLADFVIWSTLVSWFPTKVTRTLLLYWCSPIIFYISYIHGQLDAIPTAILFLSVTFLIKERFLLSGLLYGAAIASKFHVLAGAPLFILYAFRRSGRIKSAIPDVLLFLGGTAALVAAGVLPFALDPAFRQMVFGEGESRAVFSYFINVAPNVRFYVCPAAVALLLVKFSTYTKTNRDILILYFALVFASLVLLLPPAPGWYFWSVPFLVYFFIRQTHVSLVSYWTLSVSYLTYYLIKDWGKSWGLDQNLETATSITFTVLQAILAFVIFWVYKVGVKSNEEYKPVRKPFLIGIGGDSSTGKHTFANSISSLVGQHNLTQVNGDDYHKWPRGHESWKTITHLNPQGNHLHLPIQHIHSLKNGHLVRKRSYDHKTGQFTVPTEVEPRNFILYVGLHPFYLPRMRAALDLKIFMETDEKLRTNWKVARDSQKRGYSEGQVMDQIEKRRPDGDAHIQPQKNFADLIVTYLPTEEIPLEPTPPLMVKYTLKSDINIEPLVEKFTQIPSLILDWRYLSDLENQTITVAGFIKPNEVEMIAYDVFPNLDEIVLNKPVWEEDVRGINQLMTLAMLSDQLVYQ